MKDGGKGMHDFVVINIHSLGSTSGEQYFGDSTSKDVFLQQIELEQIDFPEEINITNGTEPREM